MFRLQNQTAAQDESGVKRPLLLYDGGCGFCRAKVAQWRNVTGDAVDYEPYQEAGADFPWIPRTAFAEAVFLVEPDGRTTRAAEAILRALELGGHPFGARIYRASGWARALFEGLYRWVARNRTRLGRLQGSPTCSTGCDGEGKEKLP